MKSIKNRKSAVPESGSYRLVQIIIGFADGFYGDDPDDGLIVIGDFRWLWWAKLLCGDGHPWVVKIFTGDLPCGAVVRQVHDKDGDCIYYHDGKWGRDPRQKTKSPA